MTVQTYPGVTPPRVRNSADATPYRPGSCILLLIAINGSGSNVSSISVAGSMSAGVSFSRLGFVTSGAYRYEAWGSTPFTSAVVPGAGTFTYTVNFNTAPSGGAVQNFYLIDNCSGFRNSVGSATGTTSAFAVTDLASTTPNSVLIIGVATNTTSPSFVRWTASTPAALNNNIVTSTTAFGPVTSLSANAATGLVDGIGVIPSVATTFTGTIPTLWLGLTVVALGVSVQMDDTNPCYMITEAGLLLNNNTAIGGAIYDVSNVAGLDDQNVKSDISDIDGADGSYIAAKFLAGKTIVLDGTLYYNPPVPQSVIDAMKPSVRPDRFGGSLPFFFKYAELSAPRYIPCKGQKFQADANRTRTLGQIPFQYQIATADIRAYSPRKSMSQNTLGTIVGGAFAAAVPVSGNAETFPIIYFTYYSGETAPFVFKNGIWDGIYNFTSNVTVSLTNAGINLPVGAYALDLGALSLTNLNTGVDYSLFITTRQWFGLVQNITNYVTCTRTSSTEGFTIAWGDAWL